MIHSRCIAICSQVHVNLPFTPKGGKIVADFFHFKSTDPIKVC